MAGVCSALNKTMATTTMGIAVMGLERQVIAACGSAVCGDDLAVEVPVFGPAAAPVEASAVATYIESRESRVSVWSWSPWRVMSWLSGYPSRQAHESPHTHGSSLSSRDDCPASPRAATNNSAGPSRRPLASQQCEGRAHGPQVRASASWRRRGRCLAARGLAAGLLVAVAALLALPLQAEAQKTTFVSNTGQSTDPDVREVGPHGHLWQLQAQQFRTGDNEGGYTLSAIQVRVDDFGSNSRPKVSIYTTSSGNPGTSLYVLTNPATLNDDAINTFRAPANATLEKDTNYFVVFEELGSGSNLRYDLEVTASNAEDSGKASGWNIANSSRQRSTTITTWSDLAGKLKIAVRGTLPPALSIADASAAENAGHLLFEVTLSRSFQNTVKVDFETISGGTATEGEDYHARRKYTHVILAGDRTAQMGFALIEDTVNEQPDETVEVRLSNARQVDAYGDKIADLDITTDEATGTITAPATTTTNVSNLNIRIQDASAERGRRMARFQSQALEGSMPTYVCYDFETISGGTATEGRDYSKRPKVGQWVQIGKRVDKPFVRIIDDAINDDGETVKVKISNARLCNDASKTVSSIENAEATGTINNSDPMPLAWMVRFGRTVGSQVVDALGQRLDGGTASHVTVGGINLTGEPGALPETPSDDPFGLPDWATRTQREESAQSLTANELLLRSAFHLSSGGGQGGGAAYTAWGRVARSGFDAEVDDVTMDGRRDERTHRVRRRVGAGACGRDALAEQRRRQLPPGPAEGRRRGHGE